MRQVGTGGGRRLLAVALLGVAAGVLLRSVASRRLEPARIGEQPPSTTSIPSEPSVASPAPSPPAPGERTARRGRRRAALVLTVLAGLAAAGYLASRYLPGNDVSRPMLATSAASASHTIGPPATTAARAATAPTTAARAATATTPTVPHPTTAAVGFVPARTFLWPARGRARSYLVTFRRNGRVVLERTTTAPRLELPASFRFSAARYRWTVWALPRAAGVGPQADSSFRLTAAAAAAANGP